MTPQRTREQVRPQLPLPSGRREVRVTFAVEAAEGRALLEAVRRTVGIGAIGVRSY